MAVPDYIPEFQKLPNIEDLMKSQKQPNNTPLNRSETKANDKIMSLSLDDIAKYRKSIQYLILMYQVGEKNNRSSIYILNKIMSGIQTSNNDLIYIFFRKTKRMVINANFTNRNNVKSIIDYPNLVSLFLLPAYFFGIDEESSLGFSFIKLLDENLWDTKKRMKTINVNRKMLYFVFCEFISPFVDFVSTLPKTDNCNLCFEEKKQSVILPCCNQCICIVDLAAFALNSTAATCPFCRTLFNFDFICLSLSYYQTNRIHDYFVSILPFALLMYLPILLRNVINSPYEPWSTEDFASLDEVFFGQTITYDPFGQFTINTNIKEFMTNLHKSIAIYDSKIKKYIKSTNKSINVNLVENKVGLFHFYKGYVIFSNELCTY